MQSITRDYLAAIISRLINTTIQVRREAMPRHLYDEYQCQTATDAEILDFIVSIPYFDEKLKNFIIGNLGEPAIIISNGWEIEFIKTLQSWCESDAWLYGDLFAEHPGNLTSVSFLTLPF